MKDMSVENICGLITTVMCFVGISLIIIGEVLDIEIALSLGSIIIIMIILCLMMIASYREKERKKKNKVVPIKHNSKINPIVIEKI